MNRLTLGVGGGGGGGATRSTSTTLRRTTTKSDVADDDDSAGNDGFQIRYIDLERVIDLNDVKRFKQLAANVDLNEIQLGNKPFLFHAILKNDSELVEFLLDEEIDLSLKYQVEIETTVPNSEGEEESEANNLEADVNQEDDRSLELTTSVALSHELELVDALEYAKLLDRAQLARLIRKKMDGPSLEQRWLKCVERLDIEQIDEFRKKFKNSSNKKELLELGLVKSADLGSNKLIDYFLNHNVDVNGLVTFNSTIVTPLLQAIANKKRETAKYLIFRKADIHKKGEYGDALVTAVHYESPNDLITTILEKGASLASRHRDWPNLNLREYCVQFNKVQAKSAIDAFVFRLIASGEYEKLKSLYENGYISINVTNRFRKTGRDLAMERCHYNIVQLIDKIEERERRIKTKMGY